MTTCNTMNLTNIVLDERSQTLKSTCGTIYICIKVKDNKKSTLIEVRRVVTPGTEWGAVNRRGTREILEVLLMFCFLIWMLVLQLCSFSGNLFSYTVRIYKIKIINLKNLSQDIPPKTDLDKISCQLDDSNKKKTFLTRLL